MKTKNDTESVSISTRREQWMIAQTISGVVIAYNAAHCSRDGETEAVNMDPDYVKNVAGYIVDFCHKDHMAIEDMIDVLRLSLEIINSEQSVGVKTHKCCNHRE